MNCQVKFGDVNTSRWLRHSRYYKPLGAHTHGMLLQVALRVSRTEVSLINGLLKLYLH